MTGVQTCALPISTEDDDHEPVSSLTCVSARGMDDDEPKEEATLDEEEEKGKGGKGGGTTRAKALLPFSYRVSHLVGDFGLVASHCHCRRHFY